MLQQASTTDAENVAFGVEKMILLSSEKFKFRLPYNYPKPKAGYVESESEEDEDEDEEEDEDADVVTTRQTRSRKRNKDKELTILCEQASVRIYRNMLSIDHTSTKEGLISMPNELFARLVDRHLFLHSRQKHDTITKGEAMDYTNYLCHRLLGPVARTHIKKLLESYEPKKDGERVPGLAAKAKVLSQEKGIPKALKAFYKSFADGYLGEEQKSEKLYRDVLYMHKQVIMYQKYEKLIELCENKDPELLRFFRKKKKTCTRGRGYKTLGREILIETMGLKGRSHLDNLLSGAMTLSCVVEWAGSFGCLAFIPKESMNK